MPGAPRARTCSSSSSSPSAAARCASSCCPSSRTHAAWQSARSSSARCATSSRQTPSAARGGGKGPLIGLSGRGNNQAKPEREQAVLELVERHFDRVLVHGDPRVAAFERSFPPAARLGHRLQYTGYVVDEPPRAQVSARA